MPAGFRKERHERHRHRPSGRAGAAQSLQGLRPDSRRGSCAPRRHPLCGSRLGGGGAVFGRRAPRLGRRARRRPPATPAVPPPSPAPGGCRPNTPHLPAMAISGLPRARALPGLAGAPRPWLAAATFLLLAAAFPAAAQPAPLRRAAFATASPVMAFPIALGITDPPALALTCLALSLLTRPARPAASTRAAAARTRAAALARPARLAADARGAARPMKDPAPPAPALLAPTIAPPRRPRPAPPGAAPPVAAARRPAAPL